MCARSNVCAFRIGFVAAYVNAGLYIWFKLESIKVNLKNKLQICVRYLCSLRYKLVISFLLETVYMERRRGLLL